MPILNSSGLLGLTGLEAQQSLLRQSGLLSRTGLLYQPGSTPTPSIPTIAPSTQWNGTLNSGFGGANPAVPVDPTRTTAKPVAVPLFVPFQTYGVGSTATLGFDVYANGLNGLVTGISECKVWLEGNSVVIPRDTRAPRTTVNGAVKYTVGRHVYLDVETALTIASGQANLYLEVTPNDPTMQKRVLGPILLNFRSGASWVASPEGGPRIYDGIYPVGASQTYTTLKLAGDVARAAGKLAPLFYLTDNAGYPFDQLANQLLVATSWSTIMVQSGKAATLGNGSTFNSTSHGQSARYDGIRFAGSNFTFDVCKAAEFFGAGWVQQTGAAGRLWLDGINITTSTYGSNVATGTGGSGSHAYKYGRQATDAFVSADEPYATDCLMDGMAGDGLKGFKLNLGNTLNNVGGSAMAFPLSNGAVHDVSVDKMGGYWSGGRTYDEGLDISYTGPSAAWGYAKTGTNGNAGTFDGYLGITASITTTTMTVTVAAADVNLQVGTSIYIPSTGSTRTITALGTGTGGTGTYTITASGSVASTTMLAKTYTTPIVVSTSSPATTTLMGPLCTTISGWGGAGAWTGTAFPTCIRAACYLTLTTVDPADAIPVTQGTSGPNRLKVIQDIHSDLMAIPYRLNEWENVGIRFVTCTNLIQSATFSAGKTVGASVNYRRDFVYRNCSVQDVSATVSLTDQQNYIQSTDSHVTWENMSFSQSRSFIGSTYSCDAYCSYNYNAWTRLDWSITVNPLLRIAYSTFQLNTDLAVINAVNSVSLAAYPESSIFVNAAGANLTPKNSGSVDSPVYLLQIPSGITGRLNIDGSEANAPT